MTARPTLPEPAKPGSWLITRPEPEAQRLVRALVDRGVPALAVPLLVRAPVPMNLRPGPRDLVVVTSASVIPSLTEVLRPDPAGPTVVAVAPKTAAALEAEGYTLTLAVSGGAVALAEAVARAWSVMGSFDRIVWPTSDVGVESAEQAAAMRVLGGLVDHAGHPVEIHRPIAATVAVNRAANVSGAVEVPGHRWFFASPSAVEALWAIGVELPIPAAVVCLGASTVEAVRRRAPAGWPEVRGVESGDLVGALLRLGRGCGAV